MIPWKCIGAAALALAIAACPAWAPAATGIKVTGKGVDLWVPPERFRAEAALPDKNDWEAVPPENLPRAADRAPVLASASLVAAVDDARSTLAVYTREGSRVTKRGEVSLGAGRRFAKYGLVRDARQDRLGVQVYAPEDRLLSTVFLSADGILEFQPAGAKDLTLCGARLKYGMVPSLVGTDLVFTAPSGGSGAEHLYLPSMNLLVSLVEGEDAVMVGVWPPGQQVVSLRMSASGAARQIDGLSIQTAGASFFLTFLARPGIWHAEPLKPGYVERDTTIDWKRPLEAKWIGRFYVASEEVNYPFYFRYDHVQLWGRCIRGWFWWPVYFQDDETVIHFEKRFPPQGELLIYFLEKHPERPANSAVLSPVEVMQKALGPQETARLLDSAGIDERTVVSHGKCVCEMTAQMQKYFDAGQELQRQAEIAKGADDVATFISRMRERLTEYRDFAAQTKALIQARAAADPKLAASAARLLASLDEFEKTYQNNMSRTPLEDVREWTRQFNALARQSPRPDDNNKKFDAVAEKCRGVSQTQDDLARDLSVQAIRVTEQAAQEAVHSPGHASLAREVILRTRAVLRRPSVWEVRRHHNLPVDPGDPEDLGELE